MRAADAKRVQTKSSFLVLFCYRYGFVPPSAYDKTACAVRSPKFFVFN